MMDTICNSNDIGQTFTAAKLIGNSSGFPLPRLTTERYTIQLSNVQGDYSNLTDSIHDVFSAFPSLMPQGPRLAKY